MTDFYVVPRRIRFARRQSWGWTTGWWLVPAGFALGVVAAFFN